MPVDLRIHDPDDDIDIDPGTNKARIVKLLYTHPNLGYKPAEVRERLGLPEGSVTTALLRLQDEGKVGKTTDGYYHALESRDDLRRFATGLVQIERLTERYADDELSPADAEQTKPRTDQLGGNERRQSTETAIDDELEELEEELQ